MMLLRTVEPGQATGTVAKIYSAFERAGEVPLPMRLFSASPGLQERQFDLLRYYLSHPRLGSTLLASIRYVAARISCHDACVAFNGALLARQGMSAEEVEALAEGAGPIALEGNEAELLAFVRRALAAPGDVTGAEIESLRAAGWTDGDMLDALAHATNLVGASILHKAFVRP